ncbi:RNA-directed DNA polymerase, eukaryota, reverse transcriptase zinc-binding domain protein [Tanacetum coccineum]
MAGSGGGWLDKRSIESNDGRGGGGLVIHRGEDCFDGCDGASRGEVNGRGVVLGVFKNFLGEIPDDVIGERGGEKIRLDGGSVWLVKFLKEMGEGMFGTRLKPVLGDLMDVNQSAFILGRQISDNILLAQEFMQGYHRVKIAKNCAFKIDVQKAYDTVSWDFLEFCLREFGFHPVMVHWIMVCLKTASFSVCVNGESKGFFKARRGLRQGDLISPYLFTLVMEVLNLMVKRQIRNDKRFRYHFGCGKLKIKSLCFADDLLMLCHGDMISASILRRGLDEFSMSSGLYPSEAKSEAFFFGLTPEVKDEIKLVMPFREGSLPIRYLGEPLSSKSINKNDCRVLVEVVQNMVNDLRNKCLSFAGKLQLISSILSSLHVYWCSLFILPKLVCDTIDKIIKNLFWTKGGNATGKVSVCWKDVCKPKSQGGLGLKPLHDWNEALMAKHLWRNNLWDVELKNGQSWVWLQLLNLRDKIRRFSEVVNIPVPAINNDYCDRVVWIDKKGRERNFKVSEVWKAIRTDSPKVIWSENESHSHLFFSCAYSKRPWERLKPMAMMDNMSNIWPSVISSIVNKPTNNTIWSVDRTVDSIFEQVVSNVRLNLRGLVLKNSPDVLRAAEI